MISISRSVLAACPGQGGTIIRRVVAGSDVDVGRCVYGDPNGGPVNVDGTGEFLGVALASPVGPGRRTSILARGLIEGLVVRDLPSGTALFEGIEPSLMSTEPNPSRPAPIGEVRTRTAHDMTKFVYVLGALPETANK